MKELIEYDREKVLEAAFRFIADCNKQELAQMIEEMRTYHDNLFAFSPDTGELIKIESVSLNGDGVQLNLQSREE